MRIDWWSVCAVLVIALCLAASGQGFYRPAGGTASMREYEAVRTNGVNVGTVTNYVFTGVADYYLISATLPLTLTVDASCPPIDFTVELATTNTVSVGGSVTNLNEDWDPTATASGESLLCFMWAGTSWRYLPVEIARED